MQFYSDVFDSLFVFFRNVFAVLGVVLAFILVLEWRRAEVETGWKGQGAGTVQFDPRYRPNHLPEEADGPLSRVRDGARELFERSGP